MQQPYYPRYPGPVLPHSAAITAPAEPYPTQYPMQPPPPPPAAASQYIYPSYAQPPPPYLSMPNPHLSAPPAPTAQYPVQPMHVLSPYMQRPPMQPPVQPLPVQQYVVSAKDTPERHNFYVKLHAFRDEIGEPIQRLPTLGFKELDLWVLYKEVTKRRGIDSVIAKKQWKEVAEALQLPSSCTDSGFRLRLHYKKYLEAFERKFYRPPPSADAKKEPKKLERAMSVESTESAVTHPVGENSGSSGSRRSSGPASSGDSIGKTERERHRTPRDPISKPAGVKKKKRAPSIAKPRSISDPDIHVAPLDKHDKRVNVPKRLTVAERLHKADHASRENGMLVEGCSEKAESLQASPRSRSWPSRHEENMTPKGAALDGRQVAGKDRGGEEDTRHLGLLEAAVMAVDKRSRDRQGSEKQRRKVDFSVLDDSTLKRYAKAYDVRRSGKTESNKSNKVKSKRDLAESVSNHFSSTPLAEDEKETLLQFIRAVKRS